MIPRLSFGEFIEVLLGEQIAEGVVVFGYHFFKGSFRFFRVGCCSQVIGMMDCSDDEFFVHADREDGFSFLEFFVPFVVGIGVGQSECVPSARASTE